MSIHSRNLTVGLVFAKIIGFNQSKKKHKKCMKGNFHEVHLRGAGIWRNDRITM